MRSVKRLVAVAWSLLLLSVCVPLASFLYRHRTTTCGNLGFARAADAPGYGACKLADWGLRLISHSPSEPMPSPRLLMLERFSLAMIHTISQISRSE